MVRNLPTNKSPGKNILQIRVSNIQETGNFSLYTKLFQKGKKIKEKMPNSFFEASCNQGTLERHVKRTHPISSLILNIKALIIK